MFYKFNNITQKLVSSQQDASMGRTISPQAFTTTLNDSKEVFYDFKPVTAHSGAQQSATVSSLGPGHYAVPNNKTYRRLMALQTRFTANDGKMVWQKLPRDMPLYFLAMGLVVVGTAMTAYSLKSLASPPENK